MVLIKGDREGLHLFCAETALWSDIIAEIKKRLSGEHRLFFAGAGVIVEIGGRVLNAREVGTLWSTLQKCGVKIKGIKANPAGEPELFTAKGSPVWEKVISDTDYLTPGPLYVLRRNLRSGQSVNFDGHLLVLGDVNPGAELVATGFIMVWGALRGTAHAGAAGDTGAWVMAQRLQPTQLRIAHCIACAPAGEPQGSEIARILDGVIICETI